MDTKDKIVYCFKQLCKEKGFCIATKFLQNDLVDGINKGHFRRINTTMVAASLLASIYIC